MTLEKDLIIESLRKENAELKILLASHENDEGFGILTRKGLDLRLKNIREGDVIIFLDMDNMKHLNEIYLYKEVDKKINKLFSYIRQGDVIIGRYFSGDEIVLILPKNNVKIIIDRLKEKAGELGLSFTFAEHHMMKDTVMNIYDCIDVLAQKVLDKKKERCENAK
jgi:GGDEF domain-containing protein